MGLHFELRRHFGGYFSILLSGSYLGWVALNDGFWFDNLWQRSVFYRTNVVLLFDINIWVQPLATINQSKKGLIKSRKIIIIKSNDSIDELL